MSYELLNKLYYKDYDLFNREYNLRKNGPFSVSLQLNIHEHEAFFVNIPEFITITSRLYKKLSDLNKFRSMLPGVAYQSYERNCLIDEIILSNDIEGVRSTRKEIVEILDSGENAPKKKRFEGMIWKYVRLLDTIDPPYSISLESSADIRKLYDEIVLDEIQPSNHPDGEIFRKDIAEVISSTQQVKHQGIHPETKIIEYIDKTLALFKRDDIPELFKIAILHYMIGYIHPFYDGNGRLSRFISSYLLKKEFNTLIALRLSYTIKEHKSDYYKAFDIANDPHNMGDLTPFILYFANVVEQSADTLIQKLADGAETLNAYRQLLDDKYRGIEQKQKEKTHKVLWFLIQNALFSNEPFDKQTLAQLLKVSIPTVDNYIRELIQDGAPITISKIGRKNIYELDSVILLEYLRSKS